MRKQLLTLAALTLLSPTIQGQTIKVPPQLSITAGQPGRIVAETDGANVVWKCPDRIQLYDTKGQPSGQVDSLTVMDGSFFGGDTKRAMIFGAYNGQYRLWAFTAKGDKIADPGETMVTVVGGQLVPTPTPIKPPGPGPGPDPPNPPPNPGTAKALRVLLVYDKDKELAMPPAQYNMIFGVPFRTWLDSKVVTGADNWPAWRIYASNQTGMETAPKEFQALFNRPRTAYPWVVLADGTSNAILYEGALPADDTSTKALISKYLAPTGRNSPGRAGTFLHFPSLTSQLRKAA